MHPDNKKKMVRDFRHEPAKHHESRPSGAGGIPPPDPARPDDDPGSAWPDTRPSSAQLTSRRRPGALWFLAIFWNSIAFPMAGLSVRQPAPFLAPLFCLVFVGIGLALLWEAWQQSWLAWRYRGSRLQIHPARPRAGQTLEVDLQLPRRAVETWPSGETPHWCLSQHRIDDSSSGSPEREVQSLDAPAQVQDLGADGLRLRARLTVPADAPPDGCHRGGDRVEWRLSLRTASGKVLQDYGVPVREGRPETLAPGPVRPDTPAAPDRFARLPPPPAAIDIPPEPPGTRPPLLPTGVRWRELPHAGVLDFAQRGWRRAGLLALVLVSAWAMFRGGGLDGPAALGMFAGLGFAAHGLTRRWTLRVLDDGLQLEKSSWLWTTRIALPASALDRLFRREAYRRQHDGRLQDFHALHTPEPAARGGTRLSPAMPGPQSAEALAGFLRWAWAQRRGRFSPGAWRDRPSSGSQPGWGLVLLLALAAWRLVQH